MLIVLKVLVNVVNRPMGFATISASTAGMFSICSECSDGTCNYHAVSSCDNPCIESGQRAHGGVALLWRYSVDDFVIHIEKIDSDRIVGIKYELNGKKPLFILSVYLPSSSHTTEEYGECSDLLWSLCDSLSVDGYPIVLGDLNGDLVNSLGEKGTIEPNERGRLLLNFADYFDVCPVKTSCLCVIHFAENTVLQLTTYSCLTVCKLKNYFRKNF